MYLNGLATITDLLNSTDEDIRGYGNFLFEMDYAPYTAKQWGMKASDVDPSILKRVPVRISYEEGYYDDKYQCIPADSFTSIIRRILNHPNIKVELNVEAMDHLIISDKIRLKESDEEIMVVYTGPLDQLFSFRYGKLPYRSLRFEWKHEDKDSFQKYPVVAYPQEVGYTRITEYSKLPIQSGKGTTYAIEYPLLADDEAEPYYPVSTSESREKYDRYAELADSIENLLYCGRLGDFRYYDMDEALEHALKAAAKMVK